MTETFQCLGTKWKVSQLFLDKKKELPQSQVILTVEHDRKNYKLKEMVMVQPITA